MGALILSQADIRALLPMATCMDLVASGLRRLARGEVQNPLRSAMRIEGRDGLLGMMPGAVLSEPEALGMKVLAVFPKNHGTELDAHQGLVLLFDPERGAPAAILDAAEVTAIRTGAASGVATRLLANEDAGDLGILGSGVQARTHLAAMLEARPVRRVRVYSPTPSRREAFAETEGARHGITVEAVGSAEEAVRGADLICTTTSSDTPVLEGAWISPGAHVNAAGSSVKNARELDTAAVQRSRLFVDRRESAVNEAGDYLLPLAEGAIDENHIQGEIGDLLLGKDPGRGTPDEVTLFKSLGLAVEDLVTARWLLDQARATGRGVEVEIGGSAEDSA